LNAEDVVVDREHVHGGGRGTAGDGDSDLRVIDPGEVAGTGGLMLLGLEREGVRVHPGVGGAGVVVVGLHLVEVLTLLFLETVLAVENKLEGGQGTRNFLSETLATTNVTNREERHTGLAGGHERVTREDGIGVGLENNISRTWEGGEVPEGGGNVSRRGVVEAPHELLNGVVVRQALVLGRTGRGDGVGTSVLNLFDQVFVTLLGEAATLFGVQVDVVGPHLEGAVVKVGGEISGQIEIDTDFVVLQRDQRQKQTGVAVEEENQGQVHSLAGSTSGHLTPRSLLGFVQVKLRVQTPPSLVVFVDALTTDGQLSGSDGTLRNPVSIITSGRTSVGSAGLEFDVHVTDEITVTGDSHGHATVGGGGTVDGLLDVLHREVGVALVNRLEEGHFRVSGKVDVLSAVSYELHETTSHFESCCSIHRENNSEQTRRFRFQFFSV